MKAFAIKNRANRFSSHKSDLTNCFKPLWILLLFRLLILSASAQEYIEKELDSLLSISGTITERKQISVYRRVSHINAEYLGEPWEALKFARKAQFLSRKLGLAEEESISERVLSAAFNKTDQVDSALYYATRRINFVERQLAFDVKGDLRKEYILKNNLIRGLLDLAAAYQNLNDYQESIKSYNRMLVIIDELKEADARSIVPTLNFTDIFYNLANLHYQAGEYFKAIGYYQRIFEEGNGEVTILIKIASTIQLGQIYREIKQYEKSIETIQSVIDTYQSQLGKRENITALISLSKTYAAMDKIDKAIETAEKALWIGLSTDLITEVTECYKKLSQYHVANENFREAHRYLTGYLGFRVAELNKMDEREIGRIEAKYEAEAVILEDRLKYEQEITTQKNRNLAFGIGGGVLLIILIILVWNLKLLRTAKRLKSAEHDRQLSEKNLRLKELELIAERTDRQKEIDEFKKERLQNVLDYKRRQLTTSTISHENLKGQMRKVHDKLVDLGKEAGANGFETKIKEVIRLIKPAINSENDWKTFQKHFESVHPKFFSELRKKGRNLTENELKHCAYVQMQLTNKEVANMTGISPDSVKMARSRIKKKLNLINGQPLSSFLNALGANHSRPENSAA